MNVAERLNEIREMISFKLFRVADKRVDSLYEDFVSGKVKLTVEQEETLYCYIERISRALYGQLY